MEEIYRRHIINGTSFESTLGLIQDLLNRRINSNCRRIWVQGSNSGKARLCFTLFINNSYTMRFLDANGFRQFRHNGVLGEEIVLIERFIESLRTGLLSDIIEG